MERTRVERLGMIADDGYKSLARHGHNKEMIEVADRKCLYNRIKEMVECEMKASEHLFQEDCPKYVCFSYLKLLHTFHLRTAVPMMKIKIFTWSLLYECRR